MSNYSRGRALEHDMINLLKAQGYSVIRGAGSKGDVLNFKTDLLATKWTDQTKRQLWMVLLQCKVSKR